MITVIQRVSSSSVKVDGQIVGEISKGLNILLGVKKGDDESEKSKLADKVIHRNLTESYVNTLIKHIDDNKSIFRSKFFATKLDIRKNVDEKTFQKINDFIETGIL